MKTVALSLTVIVVAIGLPFYLLRKTGSGFQTLPLVQKYTVHAVRGRTYVSASVKFWDAKNDRYFYPSKVEFNGRAMKNEELDDSGLYDPGCPAPKSEASLPKLYLSPNQKQSDPSVFSLVAEGNPRGNTVTIYDESGASRSYEIYFEPVQFAQPDGVALSRSKDNVIQLKGSGGKEKDPMFGLEGAGSDVESLIRFDASTNTVTIPAAALKKMKKGSASFRIISSDTAAIETIVALTGKGYIMFENSYITLFTDETCARIVD